MRVIIRDTYEMMSKWAANAVAEKIKKQEKTKPFVLGLPTGSTPQGVYRLWVEAKEKGLLSFSNVVTFNMDEYVGLSPDDENSYHVFMYRNLFDLVDIPKENVHILDGTAIDLEGECQAYESAITAAGGIALFLGGIGRDGHIAFNEPYTPFTSRTGVRTLTADTVAANARFFGNDEGRVPKRALSVGIGTVMDAGEVMILASGRNKAHAVWETVEGPISHKCPASVLQLHENVTLVCDGEAASELSKDAVRFFRETETA